MLKLEHVYKTFNPGTINQKRALNDLNLTLNPGDFVTVIGGNGAGKSTMLNAICGVWKPDSGKIIIDGTDVTNMPEHRRAQFLGRVFQDPMMGTAADMGIEENLALAYRRGKARGLAWGMASLQEPKLLLLDEHTAALDPKTAAKVLALSDEIVSAHKLTTLMVTHNMKDAIAHGNRLIMLHDGQVILDIAGEEKKNLTVEDLLAKFSEVSGQEFASDRALLN